MKNKVFRRLWGRKYSVSACPPAPSRIYSLSLSNCSCHTHACTLARVHEPSRCAVLRLCSQNGVYVWSKACSWAVYIHGESHLGGSQTVCLWPCLPVVTHRVQCSCSQAGGSSESRRRVRFFKKKLHFGAVRWQGFLGHLGASFEVEI